NLDFRGRIARSWEIYEEAYFYYNESARIPGRGRLSPAALVTLLESAMAGELPLSPETQRSLSNIDTIEMINPEQSSVMRGAISLTLTPPQRFKLTLRSVDQNLFKSLATILGDDYFTSFAADAYLHSDAPVSLEQKSR